MILNTFAAQPHFIDHLAPVYLGMLQAAPDQTGKFCAPEVLLSRAQQRGIPQERLSITTPVRTESSLTLVASIGDVKTVLAKGSGPIALLEHGCGLHFSNACASHSGGSGARAGVNLFLMTNESCASRDRAAYPSAKVAVIGAPKLDPWIGYRPQNERPVVCVTTHWDCYTAPETRSALPYYRTAYAALAKTHHVIGHAHPRARREVWAFYEESGIEAVKDFSDVLRRSDLLLGDCGSAPYEFAATGRPVVVVNCPLYRRHIHHGLRFWAHVPGPQVWHGNQLANTVDAALADPPAYQALRAQATAVVYPWLGCATARAVSVLRDYMEAVI